LIEKYAGAFPLWLAPVQVKLIPIADRHLPYIEKVKAELEKYGIIRVEIDDRSEKMGYKIREAQLEKIPYMIIAGDKDIENNVVAVRSRKDGDLGTMSVDDLVTKLIKEIAEKQL
ncbi:MAG: threonine--tRNA ligase, partial [Clostridia bacterium]|nr:threonine--tRNA ligase [Clostridia bacterium]